MTTVTILLPTYNRAHFLPYAIESALSQTHRDIQLVILDDASSDSTSEAVQPYLKDTRVRYIRHVQNKGITGNWRSGLEMVDTEFFCFLEDDDVYGPDFVQRMIRPLQEDTDIILSFCDHWAINAAGEQDHSLTEIMSHRFGRTQLAKGKVADLAEAALISGSVSITSTMFRSEFVSADFINDKAKGGIDFWLFYRCTQTGRKGYYLPERLMEYRLHGAGMSHSMPEMMAQGHLFLYTEMLQDPDIKRLHTAAKRKIHQIATSYGIHLLLSHRNEEAIEILTEALRHGNTVRAFIAYRLAVGEKGLAVARSLRCTKQRITSIFVPILHYASMYTRFLRLAARVRRGIVSRHQR